eukprot:435208-Rhodomonas_salina.3
MQAERANNTETDSQIDKTEWSEGERIRQRLMISEEGPGLGEAARRRGARRWSAGREAGREVGRKDCRGRREETGFEILERRERIGLLSVDWDWIGCRVWIGNRKLSLGWRVQVLIIDDMLGTGATLIGACLL